MGLLYVYIGLVLFLVIAAYLLKKNIRISEKYMIERVEQLNLIYLKGYESNKSDFYKLEKAIDILFDNKRKFLLGGKYELQDINSYLEILIDDMLFLEKSLNKEIFKKDFLKREKIKFKIFSNICKWYNGVRMVLGVITLGVFLVLLDHKKCD